MMEQQDVVQVWLNKQFQRGCATVTIRAEELESNEQYISLLSWIGPGPSWPPRQGLLQLSFSSPTRSSRPCLRHRLWLRRTLCAGPRDDVPESGS